MLLLLIQANISNRMQKPYISLFLGLFLAFLEIVPAVSSFADAYYPTSCSTVRNQSSAIKHLSLLLKQPKTEAKKSSEETRILDTSVPDFGSICALLPALQSNSANHKFTNYQARNRLWLLNQRMNC
ncbi:MAG: hypothetical protein DA330_05775 [Nitrososphaera sp.]|nr:hypothetical protein [Nitrososphaera sp.]